MYYLIAPKLSLLYRLTKNGQHWNIAQLWKWVLHISGRIWKKIILELSFFTSKYTLQCFSFYRPIRLSQSPEPLIKHRKSIAPLWSVVLFRTLGVKIIFSSTVWYNYKLRLFLHTNTLDVYVSIWFVPRKTIYKYSRLIVHVMR